MKTTLILTLSLFLFGCGGIPPKLEHPVKMYLGAPEVGGICRLKKSAIARLAKKYLAKDESRNQVDSAVSVMFSKDEIECVDARSNEFKSYACYSLEDNRVLLRYQENLLYSCEKWKQ